MRVLAQERRNYWWRSMDCSRNLFLFSQVLPAVTRDFLFHLLFISLFSVISFLFFVLKVLPLVLGLNAWVFSLHLQTCTVNRVSVSKIICLKIVPMKRVWDVINAWFLKENRGQSLSRVNNRDLPRAAHERLLVCSSSGWDRINEFYYVIMR